MNSKSVVLECRDLAFTVDSEWSESLATCYSLFKPLPSQRNWFTRAKAKIRNWWALFRHQPPIQPVKDHPNRQMVGTTASDLCSFVNSLHSRF
jgi:hypothetical protein